MTDERGRTPATSFSEPERELLAGREFALCVATFYARPRRSGSSTEPWRRSAMPGSRPTSVHAHEVPGAFELPLAAQLVRRVGPVRRGRMPRAR